MQVGSDAILILVYNAKVVIHISSIESFMHLATTNCSCTDWGEILHCPVDLVDRVARLFYDVVST